MFNTTELDMHRIEEFWFLLGTQTQTNVIVGVRNPLTSTSQDSYFFTGQTTDKTDNPNYYAFAPTGY